MNIATWQRTGKSMQLILASWLPMKRQAAVAMARPTMMRRIACYARRTRTRIRLSVIRKNIVRRYAASFSRR